MDAMFARQKSSVVSYEVEPPGSGFGGRCGGLIVGFPMMRRHVAANKPFYRGLSGVYRHAFTLVEAAYRQQSIDSDDIGQKYNGPLVEPQAVSVALCRNRTDHRGLLMPQMRTHWAS